MWTTDNLEFIKLESENSSRMLLKKQKQNFWTIQNKKKKHKFSNMSKGVYRKAKADSLLDHFKNTNKNLNLD